jgi:hypothetical protein
VTCSSEQRSSGSDDRVTRDVRNRTRGRSLGPVATLESHPHSVRLTRRASPRPCILERRLDGRRDSERNGSRACERERTDSTFACRVGRQRLESARELRCAVRRTCHVQDRSTPDRLQAEVVSYPGGQLELPPRCRRRAARGWLFRSDQWRWGPHSPRPCLARRGPLRLSPDRPDPLAHLLSADPRCPTPRGHG